MDEAALEAAGWTRLPMKGFSLAIGQTWTRLDEDGRRTVALVAGHEIINDYGAHVHGGALMTFADIALGTGAADAARQRGLVTVQLGYQFVGAVPRGGLMICRPEVVRRTSRLVFMRGLIEVDGEVVGSAEGMFKAVKATVD